MQNIRRSRVHEGRPQVHRSYTPGSPASARIRHGRPYAPRAARRPPQRAAPPAERHSHAVPPRFPQRGRTGHDASRPGPVNSRKSFHPPGATPATGRNANSLPPSWHTGRRQPRHASGRERPAQRCTRSRDGHPAALSVAVREKPTVRTDRPDGTDAIRYTSVDTATRRPAVTHPDTRRDKKETARRAAFPQRAGRFRR